MSHFTYRAYDQRGKLIDGTIEAATRDTVLASLHTRGFFPLEVAQASPKSGLRWWEREVFSGSAMPAARLTLFTRELATLVKADLPVDETLRIIAVQPLLPARVRRATKYMTRFVLVRHWRPRWQAEARNFPNTTGA